MSIVILHLSDVHVHKETDHVLSRGEKISAAVFDKGRGASHIFIVISGDMAQSGVASEYEISEKFINNIKNSIFNECHCPVDVIIAPGNHDCDFQKNNAAREAMLDFVRKSQDGIVDKSVLDICTVVQNDFFDFSNRIQGDVVVEQDKLWESRTFSIEGKTVLFNALNFSWVSKRKEEIGGLVFPINSYSKKIEIKADYKVSVFHHSYNWLSLPTYRSVRTFVRKQSHIVFTGHEHQSNFGFNHDVESDKSYFVEGAVLQDRQDSSNSGFNIVKIDLQSGSFIAQHYTWKGDSYLPLVESFEGSLVGVSAGENEDFPINSAFRERLSDPGAFLKHPSKSVLELSDIYEFPDLRRTANSTNGRAIIKSKELLKFDFIKNGVIVEGDEKSGRTSLFYQLYSDYHSRGFVPLYLSMKAADKLNNKNLDEYVERAIKEQYGKDSYPHYAQLSSIKKIVFVDDFDRCPLKSNSSRVSLISELKSKFGGVVLAVGDFFETKELLEVKSSSDSVVLEHFRILPFGHFLRGRLICKWLGLGDVSVIDDAEFIARRDQAERIMSTLMQKAIIPSFPLYLLVVLQGIDAGRGGEFKNSALGYYYNYLLLEAFKECGVGMDAMNEIYQYCMCLSWYFHALNRKELTEVELEKFNAGYSEEWHRVAFSSRVELLLKSRVLRNNDGMYSFRYPYIYFYLKGMYLSENIQSIHIREYIKDCCHHLYERDNANTVLFLAHHSSDEVVLSNIELAISKVFSDSAPVEFNGDTEKINKIIAAAPLIEYSASNPNKHRDEGNVAQDIEDDVEEGSDGLLDKREEGENLSDIAQLTMLFKTMEILGQLLKNKYAKITRARKAELLEKLFDAPLRALSYIYDYVDSEPKAMALEIEKALKKKGEISNEILRRSVAEKTAAELIQLISASFVFKAGQSVNSQALLEDVDRLVERDSYLSFRLIEMAVLLDSPRAIPKEKLRSLYNETKHNLVAGRILHLLVVNRMYMFKTPEKDIQWIGAELNVSINNLHSIAYQESGSAKN